jgi:hypothetical protein
MTLLPKLMHRFNATLQLAFLQMWITNSKIHIETQGTQNNQNNIEKRTRLPYDPAIPLLGIYPKECNSSYYKNTCTSMFIAALLTIFKVWK